MKTLNIELSQQGKNYIIKKEVTLTTEGEKIPYNVVDIVDALIEKKEGVSHHAFTDGGNSDILVVDIAFESGDSKIFMLATEYIGAIPAQHFPKGEIANYFDKLAGFIKGIEKTISDEYNSVTTHKWEVS